METKRERLHKLFNESKDEVKKVNIILKENISIDLSNAKRRLGVCRNKSHIEISNYMFNFQDEEIKNVIIHELLHTLDDTHGHDYRWKKYAKIINDNYKQYNITRLGSVTEMCQNNSLEIHEVLQFKYKIVCENCNKTLYRNRLSDYQKRYIKRVYKCTDCNSEVKLYER